MKTVHIGVATAGDVKARAKAAFKGGPQGVYGGRTFDVATADGARLFTATSDDRPNDQK